MLANNTRFRLAAAALYDGQKLIIDGVRRARSDRWRLDQQVYPPQAGKDYLITDLSRRGDSYGDGGADMILPRPELIECVANGRDPTAAEMFHVAGQIWIDGAPNRSAFAWGQLQPASEDRAIAIRYALAALRGGG